MKVNKSDFPILSNNPDLVYLDSACTSLKPKCVVEAEMAYYAEFGACGGRSSHRLGRLTSDRLEESRVIVASFVGAKPEELIWTRNTTEGLNIVANSLDYSKRRKVVTTVMEHHSVLLPFMKLRDCGLIDLEILDCDEFGSIPLDRWDAAIDQETALVVTNNWNNTTGAGPDIAKISSLAHQQGSLMCIDGAQGIPHHLIDLKNIDFLCFSAHKMLGPTGIGGLVVKKDLITKIKPLMLGGGTVKDVWLDKVELMKDQSRFEAGIQNYSGIFGFAAACSYLKKLGMNNIMAHENELSKKLLDTLVEYDLIIYGPQSSVNRGALYSFNFRDAKPHDVALMLDRENIAVRSGLFCAQPAMEKLGAKNGAVRASAYVYNSLEDIEKLGAALGKIAVLYK